MTSTTWRVRLSNQAEADFAEIIAWTVGRFGAKQADLYSARIFGALDLLSVGPDLPGSHD